MADLLIHSIAEFWNLIGRALTLADARHVAEIGAEFGGTSHLLAEHMVACGGTLTSIDPSPKPEFRDWARV